MASDEKIFDLLAGGVSYTLQELASILACAQKDVRRSLQCLQEAGRIVRRRSGSVCVYAIQPNQIGELSSQSTPELRAQYKILQHLLRVNRAFRSNVGSEFIKELPLPAFVADGRFRILRWSPILTEYFDPPEPGIPFTDFFRRYPDMRPWSLQTGELSSSHFIDSVVLPRISDSNGPGMMPAGTQLVRFRQRKPKAPDRFFYFSLITPLTEPGVYGLIAPVPELFQKVWRARIISHLGLGLTHSFGQPLNAIASVEASVSVLQKKIERIGTISRVPADRETPCAEWGRKLAQLSGTLERARISLSVIRDSLSEINDLETSCISFWDLLETVSAQEQRIAATKGIQLKLQTETKPSSCEIWSVPYLLAEALHCLIRNAIHGARPESSIEIGCGTDPAGIAFLIRNRTSFAQETLEFLQKRASSFSLGESSGTALAIRVASELGGSLGYQKIEDDIIETRLILPAFVSPEPLDQSKNFAAIVGGSR